MRFRRTLDKVYKKIISQEKYICWLRKHCNMLIGDNCYIDKRAVLGSEPYLISIGNNVRITEDVKFITHDGSLWVLRNMGLVDKNTDRFGRIVIGNNVNIGWNSIIMQDVTIGDNVIIGAGTIVTKSIPSNSIAVGVPAKVIENIEQYYEKNKEQFMITKSMNYKEKENYLKKNLK